MKKKSQTKKVTCIVHSFRNSRGKKLSLCRAGESVQSQIQLEVCQERCNSKTVFWKYSKCLVYFQKIILKSDRICKDSTDTVSVAAILLYISYRF